VLVVSVGVSPTSQLNYIQRGVRHISVAESEKARQILQGQNIYSKHFQGQSS